MHFKSIEGGLTIESVEGATLETELQLRERLRRLGSTPAKGAAAPDIETLRPLIDMMNDADALAAHQGTLYVDDVVTDGDGSGEHHSNFGG